VPSQSQIAHHHGLRPQFFTIVFTPAAPNGVVTAFGPVRERGIDQEVSGTLARNKDGTCDTSPNDQPVSFFGKVTAWGKATAGKHKH